MDLLLEQKIDTWVENHIGVNFKFRPHQKEQIVKILENIISDKPIHNHVIEAPTGSGKSIIVLITAGILAEYYDMWSYILCSDLYLWNQYADFIKTHPGLNNYGMIKGQTGNYECCLNHEDMRNSECRMGNVSWASLFSNEKANQLGYPCARNCEYVQARKKAVHSPVVLTTYQMFLYQINVVTQNSDGRNTFTNRPVIFCDECHNIPDIVQGKMSPVIQQSDFEKLNQLYLHAATRATDMFDEKTYPIIRKYSETGVKGEFDRIFNIFKDPTQIPLNNVKAMNDYNEYLACFTDIVEDIHNDIADRKSSGQAISQEDVRLYKVCSFYKNYMCHWNDFCNAINESGKEYLIKQVGENKDHDPVVTFNCIKEDWLVNRYLLSQADWRIMLSATVGGKEAFEENIGVKYTDDKTSIFDTIPSTFDFTKSPVFFLNRYKMSFKEKEHSLECLKPIVYNIIEKFKGKKGIIQTGNYDIAKQIVFYAPPEAQKRMLLYDGSKDKIAVIRKHKYSDDTILVGPTLCEGVDLPDDLCRFIVILKMPYPSMKDKYVTEKMKLFPLWYNSKTSNSIIQGIGRGVRNDKDYCTTYILDGCFYNLYVNTKEQYSDELQKRIKMYS
jgi:Rad3-related DNA helicase